MELAVRDDPPPSSKVVEAIHAACLSYAALSISRLHSLGILPIICRYVVLATADEQKRGGLHFGVHG